jgi:hypothetical protein
MVRVSPGGIGRASAFPSRQFESALELRMLFPSRSLSRPSNGLPLRSDARTSVARHNIQKQIVATAIAASPLCLVLMLPSFLLFLSFTPCQKARGESQNALLLPARQYSTNVLGLVRPRMNGCAAPKSWHMKPTTLNRVEVVVVRELPGFSPATGGIATCFGWWSSGGPSPPREPA